MEKLHNLSGNCGLPGNNHIFIFFTKFPNGAVLCTICTLLVNNLYFYCFVRKNNRRNQSEILYFILAVVLLICYLVICLYDIEHNGK